MPKSFAMLFLAIWFLLYGLLALTNITIVFASAIMGVLAIGIAVLILFDR